MKHPTIAQQIIALKNADLALREQLIQNKQLGESYNTSMQQLHCQNADALDRIIDTIGYPTIEKVGEEASEAAWLVIQHAIAKPNFMRKCAQLLQIAVHQRQATPVSLAYLTDRIAIFEGKQQLYGTQFDWNENGELAPNPFDDLAKVNQRRKSIGLNTLEAQTAIMRKQAQKENHFPPTDFKKRQQAMNEWRQKVGWS